MAKKTVSKKLRQPKQPRSHDTVRIILDGAERILKSEGHAAVTTTRTAQVAGVGVGTLYEYFADRKALFRGLEDRTWRTLIDSTVATMQGLRGEPLDKAIRQSVLLALDALRSRGSLHGFGPASRAVLVRRSEYASLLGRELEKEVLHRGDGLQPPALRFEVASLSVSLLAWAASLRSDDAAALRAYDREVADMIVGYLCTPRPASAIS